MSADYVGYSPDFLSGYNDGTAESIDAQSENAEYMVGFSTGTQIKLLRNCDPPHPDLFIGFLAGLSDFRCKKQVDQHFMKSHIYTFGYNIGFYANSDGIKFDLGDFHAPEPEPSVEPLAELSAEPSAELSAEPSAEPSAELSAEPVTEKLTSKTV
jgi:hypothetical protein